jgi:hypothetical protein
MKSPTQMAMSAMVSIMALPEALAGAEIKDGHGEERQRHQNEQDVRHGERKDELRSRRKR